MLYEAPMLYQLVRGTGQFISTIIYYIDRDQYNTLYDPNLLPNGRRLAKRLEKELKAEIRSQWRSNLKDYYVRCNSVPCVIACCEFRVIVASGFMGEDSRSDGSEVRVIIVGLSVTTLGSLP
jgi:hypothetical protein